MKQIFVFCMCFFCCLANAAVRQCVPLAVPTLASQVDCDVAVANRSFEGYVDWSLPCTVFGRSVTIQGLGMCSRVKGGSQFATRSDILPTVANDGDKTNVYCWCKLIRPAVSDWVYVRTYTEPDNCALSCAWRCADFAQTSNNEGANYAMTYLSALFKNLSD